MYQVQEPKMSEECPNCRQPYNNSFSRLVKDTCGHTKCRMCLLYEEQGCKACSDEHRIQNIGTFDCQTSLAQTANDLCKDLTVNKEVVLPLELVINKDSKLKESNFEFLPVDCINDSEYHHTNNRFDNQKENVHKSSTFEDSNDNTANRLYIPKIEPCNMISNIQTHLNNTDDTSKHVETNSVGQTEVQTDNVGSKIEFECPHKEKQLRKKPLKCPDRSHISVVPGVPERYKCNICNKIFRNKKGKCYHDACITGIRPYQCTFCDRSFVKRSHFEYHERVHRGYKPYKCNLCEKAFPQRNKLNRHMYSHSAEKQFICSKCSKRYSKRDDLRNHLQSHSETATYNCKVCNKLFRLLTNLTRHTRTHTNERPHKCDQCSKGFKEKSLLIRHKRTHGRERPFSCAHCNRMFLSKSELRRHITVHSDEKPFSCEYCQTVFRRKDNLNRHIRHHHLEDTTVEVTKSHSLKIDTNKKIKKTKQISDTKQKQKQKKVQRSMSNCLPKSPSKVSVVYVNSREQINSRLDSMGNITPVIRTTNELCNAVPVINGPISVRKPEEKTENRKKTFTYTEPIPLAEAVVINRRIEEKLYSQNSSGHNYFFRNQIHRIDKHAGLLNQPVRANNCTRANSSNKNCHDNLSSEPLIQNNLHQNNETSAREHGGGSIPVFTISQKRADCRNDQTNLNNDIFVKVTNTSDTDKLEPTVCIPQAKEKQANCVSTITKHTVLQSESSTCTKSVSTDNHMKSISDASLPKDTENAISKKQNNVHWRRRMAEILRPCNQ